MPAMCAGDRAKAAKIRNGAPSFMDVRAVGPAALRLRRGLRKSVVPTAKRKKRTTAAPFVDNQWERFFPSSRIALKTLFPAVFFFSPICFCVETASRLFRLHTTDVRARLGNRMPPERLPRKKGGPQQGLRVPPRNASRGRLATRCCDALSLRRSVPCGQTARRNAR